MTGCCTGSNPGSRPVNRYAVVALDREHRRIPPRVIEAFLRARKPFHLGVNRFCRSGIKPPAWRKRHEKSRLDIERFPNTLMSKPGFGKRVRTACPKWRLARFSIRPAVPYWPPVWPFVTD